MSSGPPGLHETLTSSQPEAPPALPHVIMPVQATSVSGQLPTTINHMVQGMIPALQRQLSETMNGGSNGGNTNNTNMNMPTQRSSNPFLNQIPNFSVGGHSSGGGGRQGHVRSFSYGHNFRNTQQNVNGAHGTLPYHPAQQHGHMFSQVSGAGPSHQHHHHHHHQQQQQPPPNPPQQQNPSQVNASFVLNIGENDGLEGDNGGHMHTHGGGVGVGGPHQDNNNNGQRNGIGNDPVSNLRTLWKASEGSVPFVILLLAKLLFQHRLGIIVLVGLFGTFYHGNSSLKKQIAQREGHSWIDALGNLCWIIVFLSANIFFIYYVFDEQMLYKSLYFHVPQVGSGVMDIWSLCWIVGVTDFIIKYATIILKASVTLLPKNILLFKKKGKYYMLIEVMSQFYRSLVPVIPWLLYLQTAESGGQWFAYVLCLLYLLFKGNHVYIKVKEVRKAFCKFRIDVSYGNVPGTEDLQACDNSCPICQDKFTDPVMLSCTHIFCEDCVSMWFDRERTCPMCRAQIVDNPVWRDGTTAGNIQLY